MQAIARRKSALAGIFAIFLLLFVYSHFIQFITSTVKAREPGSIDENKLLRGELADAVIPKTGPHGPCRAHQNGSSNQCPTEELSRAGAVKLPTILPHLAGKPDALVPRVVIGMHRQPVQLVIGVPTVQRATHSYVTQTLESLLTNLKEHEELDVIIVLMAADITDLRTVDAFIAEVRDRFNVYIAAGMLVIIAPSLDFYPDFDRMPATLNDPPDRMKWRTKQTLDFAYLMMYCQTRGRYYLQLEDDIVTKPDYMTQIQTFINKHQRENFVILEFAELGFIAKLFRTSDLSSFIEFILLFHRTKPVDWLLGNYLFVKVCWGSYDTKFCPKEIEKAIRKHKPSLFQHVGVESSLKGKVQLWKETNFDKT